MCGKILEDSEECVQLRTKYPASKSDLDRKSRFRDQEQDVMIHAHNLII